MRLSLILLIIIHLWATLCFGQNDLPPAESSPQDCEDKTLTLLSAGKQVEAETFLQSYTASYPNDQRALFLRAALLRSRREMPASHSLFDQVVHLDPDTPSGLCASYLINLDAKRNVNQEFSALQTLLDKFPEDLIFRWMAAVECRIYNKTAEGATHYAKILETWNPGPVLVHQTYGNMLSDLKRYKDALVERRKAVELEPCDWSYEGLANTLTHLKQYDEANQIYQKIVELSPNKASYFSEWAWSLVQQPKPEEAIEKAKMAIQIDSTDDNAWCQWGDALALQNNPAEALIKFKKALSLKPGNDYYELRVRELEYKQG